MSRFLQRLHQFRLTRQATFYYRRALDFESSGPAFHINKGFALLALSDVLRAEAGDHFRAASTHTVPAPMKEAIQWGLARTLGVEKADIFYFVDSFGQVKRVTHRFPLCGIHGD